MIVAGVLLELNLHPARARVQIQKRSIPINPERTIPHPRPDPNDPKKWIVITETVPMEFVTQVWFDTFANYGWPLTCAKKIESEDYGVVERPEWPHRIDEINEWTMERSKAVLNAFFALAILVTAAFLCEIVPPRLTRLFKRGE